MSRGGAVKVGDLPLPERIVHHLRQEQEKQTAAYAEMVEALAHRGQPAPAFVPRCKVPSDKKLKAMPSEILAALRKLVDDGTLVVHEWGRSVLYEVVERDA